MLTIIARFGAGQSFPELMGNLLDLVDEHTEYFKSHLEALPPQERRVYLALARLWKPSTTREVSELARVDTNKCSSMLGRLVQRGSVAIEGGTARRKEYYLTERLYNIYYLLRRGGGEDRLVQALIDFMICLYSPSELLNFTKGLYEASHISGNLLQSVPVHMAKALIKEALALDQMGKTSEALDVYDQLIQQSSYDRSPDIEPFLAVVLLNKSFLLNRLGREREAIPVCDYLVIRFGTRKDGSFPTLVGAALSIKGIALTEVGDPQMALDACDQAIAHIRATGVPERDIRVASALLLKGLVLMLNNEPAEAIAAFDQVVMRFDMTAETPIASIIVSSLTLKAITLDQMGRTISENEFSLFLRSLAKDGFLQPGSIDALICFIARVRPARALELIQESLAAQLLLPLVTVLRRELGQTVHVAKEVDEVARDIGQELVEFRVRAQSGRPTVSTALGVTTPREFLKTTSTSKGRLRYPDWVRVDAQATAPAT